MMPVSHRLLRVAFLLCLVNSAAMAALIHEWKFNETSGTTLFDSVGTAHAQIVTLAGGGGFQLDGKRVRLDGGTRTTADYVSYPADIFDGLTNVTIEIWAEPHSFQNWGRVIDVGPGDGVPNPTTDNFRLSFSVGVNGNQQWMGLRPIPPVTSALLTQTNQLYHYAIVWSATGAAGGGATIQWYRNGAFVTNQDVGTATIANLANLAQTATWLGRSAYTGDSTANASYHAMRIYDEALDAATIALHTLKGPDNDGPDGVDGLIHRWSFSETNGTSLQDSVGAQSGQIIMLPGGGGYALTNGQLRLFGGAKATADYGEFPPGLLDGLTSVTVEAWVTPRSPQNWARLFDFGSGVGVTGTSFFLSLCRATSLNLQRLEFIPYTVDTGLPTTTNQQYHYVAVWGATNGAGGVGRMEWHRDGVLAGGVDTGSATVANVDDSVLWLGRSQYPDNTADADFNELRIYNRTLTPGEINFNRLLGPDNVNIPPPDAVDDTMIMNPGAMALIPALSNDRGSQADPDTLTIVTPPAAGTAQVKSGGKILYTHNGGPATSDQFNYRTQNSIGDTSDVATVFITISPALRLPNTTITIPNEPPPVTYQIVDAFPGLMFEDALALRTPPGRTNQLFVVERRGIVSYVPDITAANPVRQVFLDIRDQVSFDNTPQGERGLLSMAFHPGFGTNGVFFVFYVAPGGSPYFERLSRFTANPTNLTINTNTQQILFSVVDEVFNHNGGDLHFGQDGCLYVSMGDEGDQYNIRQNAQRTDKDFYSGILRLDVDKRPGSLEPTPHSAIPSNGSGQAFYSIPPDNPFVGATSFNGQPINTSALRAEFWATGFRHPWRFSFDAQTGELWAGDVGQDRYEEVNIVSRGSNYGWAYFEGVHQTSLIYTNPNRPSLTTNPPPPGFTHVAPVWEYLHTAQPGGDPQYKGNSVSGGVVYYGDRFPELNGAYIFGDFESANIWALRRTNGSVAVQRIAGTAGPGAAAFGIDPNNGDVLIANYLQNQVQRLVRTDAASSSFPAKLSDTGIFADLTTFAPNPGIVTYEPIVAFWSDYGIKRRWFTIPDLTNHVSFGNELWSLPTGMMWIKHFDLELERGNPNTKYRLETRVLVKTDTGTFGVSYKWDEAQTEAHLVGDGGTDFTLTVQDGTNSIQQQWEIPSRAGCLACHTAVGGHALSFNTREMNQIASMNGVVGNQIATLGQAGYFTAPVANVHALPALATAANASHSLESRVRSYLAVNCVQCHQPGGVGPGTWDARPFLALTQTGLINGAPYNNGGNPTNKLIVPGDPAHSVLLQRIQGNGFSRMPPLATHQLDQQAIDLLTQWIATDLINRLDFPQWQVAHFGSTNTPSAAANADPDNDGANNFYEFLTLTPPLSNAAPWRISIDESVGTIGVSFLRLANRGFLVETAPDFVNWTLWDVPANQFYFGASNELTTISGPMLPGDTNRFFRVKILEP